MSFKTRFKNVFTTIINVVEISIVDGNFRSVNYF